MAESRQEEQHPEPTLPEFDLEEAEVSFLADRKPNISNKSYQQRATTLEKFRLFLKEHDISLASQLTPQLIWEYERVRIKYFKVSAPRTKTSPRTLGADTASLRCFFGYLYDERVLLSDLSVVITSVPERRSLPRPLTHEVINKWFSLWDLGSLEGPIDRALFELIYGSGLRTGEAMSLSLTDLDLTESQVLVQKTKNRDSRIVPMTRASVLFLERYIEEVRPKLPRTQKTEHNLWLSQHGTVYTTKKIQRRVQKIYCPRVKSQYPITLHNLRHSFATHLLQAGTPVL